MVDRFNQIVPSLFFGCLACLVVTTVVDADGRVFVLDMRNSSGLQGFRDAEQACASRHARLASAEELRHSVVECFFSSCTRGWLYGGTVGTTVCNVVGSTLKAVDVRTENGTEDAAHMDAFCIKDKDVPCGDPPSFPNSRLQGHSGYEMGDELLYTCVPGYLMPSGHRAFSLLCDSCGEWYGLVEICVKDETESHVDYEEKFTDSYGETEHNHERPEEAHGEVIEQVHGAAHPGGKTSPESQETSFHVKVQDGHQDQHGQHGGGGEVISRQFEGAAEVEQKAEERAVEDFVGHPRWEQERRELVTTDEAAGAATEAPVSQLSQKHLFWFPSEAFQEQGHTVSSNPVTQTTQRASGAQSEESKEHKSQEEQRHPQRPVDVDVDHGRDDHDDHDDLDSPDDSHHDDEDEGLSHQEEDGHDDHVGPDVDRRDHDDHHDHYDMGEHEEDRTRVRYGSQEYDDHDDTYDEHESYEGHDDVTHDHGDDDVVSEEHPDQDDHEEDHGEEHSEADDSHHDSHDTYDDHDSHEDDDGDHQHVIVSIATDEGQNVTQKDTAGKATTDDTWLDGYPVVPEGTESTTERVRTVESEVETVVRTTDTPNEVDIRRPIPYTSLPDVSESPTEDTALEQEGVEETLPGFIPTAAASPDRSEPSDPPSYSDPLDYDTQQAAPTQSWLSDHTEHPFLDQDPAPPVHDGDILTEVLDEHNLPGETGERGEIEGEAGEATCTGENCPPRPPSSYSRGPTVAAIIVLICAVATAVIVGVYCYRKQQQKTSVYEMNGKGQSQNRQGQQIEMQQKV